MSLPSPQISDRLLTAEEAARWLSLAPGTLANLRVRGGGPAFVRLSRRAIRYRLSDLQAYANQRLCRSTSDPGDAR